MKTLSSIGLTNGEGAEIAILGCFINWLKSEGAELPTRRKEFNALMVRWVLYNRRVSLERLRDEGKITKEAFKRLTWGY